MGELEVSYANKLRFLRHRHGKKQIEVAEHLNLTQQAYSKLENGETSFADETIEKISDYFRITPEDFVKPFDQMNVGANSMNVNTTIHLIDSKVVEALEKLYQQNASLIELNSKLTSDLIREKDLRIQELERRK
jgi:transcriptional regulator with XRE-family HTH domain